MPAPDSARPTSEVPSVRPAYSSAQKAGLLLTLLSFQLEQGFFCVALRSSLFDLLKSILQLL